MTFPFTSSSLQRGLIVGVALAALTATAAMTQERADPIGPLTRTQTFDRAQKIEVGRTKSGKTACYFREQGNTHTLDIGISADGAFMRLDTADEREKTPAAPLKVFAGKEITKRVGGDEFSTGEFNVMQAYDGPFDYFIQDPGRDSFTVIARGDARAFLDMVARAAKQFVVVQSANDPKTVNYVGVTDFKPAAIPALMACAKERMK